MNEGEDRVLLGRIAGAHGLKGEVKIAAFTAQPEDVAAYGPLSTADGARVFEITSLRRSGGGSVIAWLQGVTDRNEAEQLRGTALYVSRAALPAAEEDEYYHLEVRAPGSRQSQLIPFERAHVPKVDLETGCVIVIWPVYESGGNKDTE
jgi:16S rRNA processing protein RimM